MPRKSGFEVAKAIREFERIGRMEKTILVLSSGDADLEAAGGLFDFVLTKPIRTE